MFAVGMTGCISRQPEPEADPDPQSPPAQPAPVSNRVPSASLDKYRQQATNAVASKWHIYVKLYPDTPPTGRLRFRFYVDKSGTPQDLKILSDARDANPRLRELTLRAILDAQIPPIPPDLLRTLPDGRIKIEYEAFVY